MAGRAQAWFRRSAGLAWRSRCQAAERTTPTPRACWARQCARDNLSTTNISSLSFGEIVAGTALNKPYAPLLIPNFHGVTVDEHHGSRDRFEVRFSLELTRRGTAVFAFINVKGSIDGHGQVRSSTRAYID